MVNCASLSRPLIGLSVPLIRDNIGHLSNPLDKISDPLGHSLDIIGYSEIITAVAIIVLLNNSLERPNYLKGPGLQSLPRIAASTTGSIVPTIANSDLIYIWLYQ